MWSDLLGVDMAPRWDFENGGVKKAHIVVGILGHFSILRGIFQSKIPPKSHRNVGVLVSKWDFSNKI